MSTDNASGIRHATDCELIEKLGGRCTCSADTGWIPGLIEAQPEMICKAFVEYDVEAYVRDYVLEGDDGSYSPNEDEAGMIADAVHGAVHELQQRVCIALAVMGVISVPFHRLSPGSDRRTE